MGDDAAVHKALHVIPQGADIAQQQQASSVPSWDDLANA